MRDAREGSKRGEGEKRNGERRKGERDLALSLPRPDAISGGDSSHPSRREPAPHSPHSWSRHPALRTSYPRAR